MALNSSSYFTWTVPLWSRNDGSELSEILNQWYCNWCSERNKENRVLPAIFLPPMELRSFVWSHSRPHNFYIADGRRRNSYTIDQTTINSTSTESYKTPHTLPNATTLENSQDVEQAYNKDRKKRLRFTRSWGILLLKAVAKSEANTARHGEPQ